MQLGMVGLGKMGANMTERLLRGGHQVVGYDRNPDAVARAVEAGAAGAESLVDLVTQLDAPKRVWVMVPSGDPTRSTIEQLGELLETGDTVIDGGNSFYKDTVDLAARLAAGGVHLLDVGTSGGIWGLEGGYSMMVGGDEDAVEALRPVFETLAPSPATGWGRMGPVGSGHFVKMVHNGIEYGIMQSYAEGFAILHDKTEFSLDLSAIGRVWQHGSVIRSWLLDLAVAAFDENPTMDGIAPYVPDSGEGRWTVAEAIELDVAAPVITLALMRRIGSRDEVEFSDRVLSALRGQFGGHAVRREDT
ncbi:MAG: decarboxylating 6-phosphogluconate dehydrogenase [Acidimicrobiia bacterium]|nr:decarboxylating 6-phosphogluconate dehydrogenase [Acidimicrobiia bacterium]MBT8216985.1 decarboxylating 6-phosphogluconate dehydrogenase [Acidimicrobiia bacterium]NNF08822.1 decarboxylating 6-phosphogluconate dehydrogenase [Acidimicrobiia bacterium]NNL68407.1 decarboxylating 6-phosphogluconate dehydrogenase [Acidimicrobiia bacterium]